MLGESDKTSFYLDYCCFSALDIFFVLVCAFLKCIYFFCTEKVKVAREVSSSVRVLKKSGGRKNKDSVLYIYIYFSANVHFKSKLSKIGQKGG